MSSKEIALWSSTAPVVIPKDVKDVASIIKYSQQLTKRDAHQIKQALLSGSYEMASTYILTKALSVLKRQLSSLGMDFIGEMLDRPDLYESSSSEDISSHDAITLAQELGIINSTQAMRLKQSLETVMHFATSEEAVEEMNEQEALLCLKCTIEAILGQPNTDLPVEFVGFRDKLANKTFKPSDGEIQDIAASPYFYKKTTLNILLSKIKKSKGAELEHTVGNLNVILPMIWPDLGKPDKWNIGQAYRNAYSDGNEIATLGLKRVLINVNGFDFVPESLRSHSFLTAASKVISAHDGMNNFYNEPAPMKALAQMGTTIPQPAFAKCMSAAMCVYLGNNYGNSWNAEQHATELFNRLSQTQWSYFINECLSKDIRVLEKISWYPKPRSRWFKLVKSYSLISIEFKDRALLRLIESSDKSNSTATERIAESMLRSLRE